MLLILNTYIKITINNRNTNYNENMKACTYSIVNILNLVSHTHTLFESLHTNCLSWCAFCSEWRSGVAGHLILSDEDLTSVVQGNWKRLNTLQHYKVRVHASLTHFLFKENAVFFAQLK